MNTPEVVPSPAVVIGDTGFLGAAVAKCLIQLDSVVAGVSRSEVSGLAAHFTADVRRPDAIVPLLKEWQPAAVFFAAGEADVGKCREDPSAAFAGNTVAFLHVLEQVRHSCPSATVVYVSTASAANPARRGFDSYTRSKSAAEEIAAAYNALLEDSGGAVNVVRPGTVIGEGDHSPTRVIPRLMEAFEGRSHFHIANANSTRPWRYISDAVSGIVVAAMSPAGSGYTLDLGRERGETFATVGELATTLAELFEAQSGVEASLTLGSDGLDDQIDLIRSADAKKLGWRPIISQRDALVHIVTGYRQVDLVPAPQIAASAVRSFLVAQT